MILFYRFMREIQLCFQPIYLLRWKVTQNDYLHTIELLTLLV